MPTRPSPRIRRAARLAVLVSGSGTNLQALMDTIALDPDFGGEVVVVGSDRPDAGGLDRARDAGVPTVVRALEDAPDRATWEAGLRAELEEHTPDVIVLAGFMRILTGAFLAGWPDRVVNTHPSLLPAFRGAHAVRDALAYGVKLTGCTVHLVDEQVDHGPIVAQEAVAVRDEDTEDELHGRIQRVEHRLLPATVKLLCHDALELDGRHVRAAFDPNTPEPTVPRSVHARSEGIPVSIPVVTTVARALVSCFDKRGVADLAQALHERGVELISTGSTAGVLREGGVPVTEVADLTGFPECLDGRVKTLHPRVHAGLLADRHDPAHVAELEELGVEPIDLVVVNLYPFADTVASGAPDADVVEMIDIGGPTMIRAAAKNHGSVGVLVDPSDYETVLAELDDHGGLTDGLRARLAATAFRHTAAYDAEVATWFQRDEAFPPQLSIALPRVAELRYGENPHQGAALYAHPRPGGQGGGVATAEQLHGKALSYNNLLDTDAAWAMAVDLDDACVAIIKHTNPAGYAVADDLEVAYERALEGDPVSAFGGIVAVNRPLDVATARRIGEVFTEVVIAPGYDPEALAVLQAKKNLRILRMPSAVRPGAGWTLRSVDGGLLMQEADVGAEPWDAWQVVTDTRPDEDTLDDLRFAWIVAKHTKSNAIVLARDGQLVGVGAGQMSRVDSVRLAVERSGERHVGAVLASDAFFPFRDGPDAAAAAGVKAIVQPGGSVRDDEVIAAADEHGIPMVFTGRRHFRH